MKTQKERTVVSIASAMIDAMMEIEESDMPDKVVLINMSDATRKNIFTPSRLELMLAIREKNPQNIGDLAKVLKRPIESISRDLKILENYGILETMRTGKEKKPVIGTEIIMMPVC